MKRFFVIVAALSVTGVAMAAMEARWTGKGATVSATSTPLIVGMGNGVGLVSIYNAGANVLYALVNASTSDMTTAISTGTAVPIPAGQSATFPSLNMAPEIDGVIVATGDAAHTNTIYIMGK